MRPEREDCQEDWQNDRPYLPLVWFSTADRTWWMNLPKWSHVPRCQKPAKPQLVRRRTWLVEKAGTLHQCTRTLVRRPTRIQDHILSDTVGLRKKIMYLWFSLRLHILPFLPVSDSSVQVCSCDIGESVGASSSSQNQDPCRGLVGCGQLCPAEIIAIMFFFMFFV